VISVQPDRFDAGLRALVGEDRVLTNAPLAELTTFHVGGPADWLVSIRSVNELRALVVLARDHAVPVTVLGGGSNVLIADAGVRGVVARLQLTGISETRAGIVRAEAGVTINGLVRWTIGRGRAGLEKWAGTPGTVGGAMYGNAHYGGTNIGDLVAHVALVDGAGMLSEVPASDMGFAYDTSRIQRTREVVVWAEFAVTTGEPAALREAAKASLAFRKRTQPLALSSAGCVFQNPDASRQRLPAGVPPSAGALVDRAGLKGARQGGAQISTRHANFVVNDGQATARDIHALIEQARQSVLDQFGVELRYEVVFLGDFYVKSAH
jgi:UDP-N-acetylmuramate dehydrogenase